VHRIEKLRHQGQALAFASVVVVKDVSRHRPKTTLRARLLTAGRRPVPPDIRAAWLVVFAETNTPSSERDGQ